jgi:acetyltransferase-like isoleucine patch superfamily enzyme
LPGKDVIIGKKCWIGMNSVILPGVCLGDHTIVGAGSVVTKSFPDGNCIIAGNPARIIRVL